jgi:hypothetical protein
MIIDLEANGEQLLPSRAVKAFPKHFGGNNKANIQERLCGGE